MGNPKYSCTHGQFAHHKTHVDFPGSKPRL